ncbi:MAG TPA: hypothetical protein VFC51_08615, partial [Chloroflexota bacterium]|nr:hypothetical protein [Chloroflexota bacterium]
MSEAEPRQAGSRPNDPAIAFVDCDGAQAASTQSQARRREVVVAGRRVKTVDVHAHCAVPQAMALLERRAD